MRKAWAFQFSRRSSDHRALCMPDLLEDRDHCEAWVRSTETTPLAGGWELRPLCRLGACQDPLGRAR